MEFIKSLIFNTYLCWGIILALLISNIILIIRCSNLKKRRKLKDEFIEIEKQVNSESSDSISDKKSSQLDNILEQMQKDMEVKPEQVVANFEAEQEKNAIISYQELVDCVKNNKIKVMEDEESEINFVQALEQEIKTDPITNIKNDSKSKSKSHLDIIDELNETRKFTNSEIISPVFGRMDPRYPKMENYTNQNSLKLGENTMDLEPVTSEIKKNEEFLKNLVDFRKNL